MSCNQQNKDKNPFENMGYYFTKYYVDNSFAQTVMDVLNIGYPTVASHFIEDMEKFLMSQSYKGIHNLNPDEVIKFRNSPEGIKNAGVFRKLVASSMDDLRKSVAEIGHKLSRGLGSLSATIELIGLSRESNAKDTIRSVAKASLVLMTAGSSVWQPH